MTRDNRPVLVAVSGSNADEAAITTGVAEARERGVNLVLVHSVPAQVALSPIAGEAVVELREIGRKVLADAEAEVRELAPDLAVTTAMPSGSPVREIAHVADDAQLVVVGRAVHHGLRGPLSGRTALGVASHAKVPTLMVPESWRPTENAPDRVIVGVAAAPLGVKNLGAALEEYRDEGASILAVHAYQVPDAYRDFMTDRTLDRGWEKDATRVVSEVLGEALEGREDVPVEIVVQHSSPGQALLEVAEGADMVVLMRRKHLMAPSGHLGSTARDVVHRANVPVLILPADKKGRHDD
jgi:nucleotide-binding universal stress UspA family protein